MHTESHTNRCTPCSSISDHKGNMPVWSPCHQSFLGLLGPQRTWYPLAQAKTPGAIFHSFLPFLSYISAISKSCQLYLQNILRTQPFWPSLLLPANSKPLSLPVWTLAQASAHSLSSHSCSPDLSSPQPLAQCFSHEECILSLSNSGSSPRP